jgi:thiamine-monophosphate kinase
MGMGELKLIKYFRAHAPTHPWLAVGPGQDCAVVRWRGGRDLAFKIDQVQEGTHFVLKGPEAATPFQVGWKAVAKACSDIAAAGFWPVAATVSLNLRRGGDEKIALGVYKGVTACCRRYSFALAGGDVSVSRNGLSVVVSLLGEGPKGGAWLRSGARAGDALLVTGTLGGSRQTGKHLSFAPRLQEARILRQRLGRHVHACIDITDGLSRDLHHLCDESGCGAVVFEDRMPLTSLAGVSEKQLSAHRRTSAARRTYNLGTNVLSSWNVLSDGEDFELLLAVEPKAAQEIVLRWRHRVPLTHIGFVERFRSGRFLVASDGTVRALPDVGYEHCV